MNTKTQAILNEVGGILGGREFAEEIQLDTSPQRVARYLRRRENTVVDEAMIDALSELTWEQISDIAMLNLLPEEEIVFLVRSLQEGTVQFREAWQDAVSRYASDANLRRGSFLLAMNIANEAAPFQRALYWSGIFLTEADGDTKKEISSKYPNLKYVTGPNGDIPIQKRETKAQREFNLPREAGDTDTDEKGALMVTRQLSDPKDNVKERSKRLKAVDAEREKLVQIAKKQGKEPEEMFPMLWRDLAHERARYS